MPESEMPQQKWYKRLIFLSIFIITNILAIFSLPLFVNSGTQSVKESTGSSFIFPIYYISAIILFTLLFIFLARKKKISVLRTVILILLGYSLFVILLLDLSFLNLIADFALTIAITAILILFSFRGNNVAVYLLGIILGAGIAAILASVITLQITIIIIAIFAIYDYISVNISKSMIEVAETAMDSKLPLLFTVGKGDETLAMGFGDVVLPTFALMSILLNISFAAYIITLLLTIISFFPMMYFASKKPQPGLPYMVNAIFLGILVYLVLYFHLY